MLLRILSLVLCLGSAAAAQCSPARYSTFGQGCRGTGLSTTGCLNANWSFGNFNLNGAAADYAILSSTGPQAIVVCSISFFVRPFGSGNVNANVSLYDRPGGGAPGSLLASTVLPVVTNLSLHTAEFLPPVVLPAATEFFIVLDNRVGLMLPFANGGQAITYYQGAPQAWNGPLAAPWKYQVNCCVGGAAPLLLNQGTPRLGATLTVLLSQAAANSFAVLFTGYSDTTWNGVPLPLDLTSVGAPGCFLRAPGTRIDVTTVRPNGTASLPLFLPSSAALCGGRLIQQWVVVDPQANALGFAFSNGGAGTIGS